MVGGLVKVDRVEEMGSMELEEAEMAKLDFGDPP